MQRMVTWIRTWALEIAFIAFYLEWNVGNGEVRLICQQAGGSWRL